LSATVDSFHDKLKSHSLPHMQGNCHLTTIAVRHLWPFKSEVNRHKDFCSKLPKLLFPPHL